MIQFSTFNAPAKFSLISAFLLVPITRALFPSQQKAFKEGQESPLSGPAALVGNGENSNARPGGSDTPDSPLWFRDAIACLFCSFVLVLNSLQRFWR